MKEFSYEDFEDWQKEDESKAKADEPSLTEDAKETIQTQVEERSRTDLMLNYSPIRSERPGGNEERFIPSRTSLRNLRGAIYPTLSEYIRGHVFDCFSESPFSSLKVMQPDVRQPLAAITMSVLEHYIPGLWVIFLEYRHQIKRNTIQTADSESWKPVPEFQSWSVYRRLTKLKHYMHRRQFQELLIDFEVIPTLISKRQMNESVSIVLSADGTGNHAHYGRQTNNGVSRASKLAAQKIEFPEFVECIVRIAILSFNGDGYDRLYPETHQKLDAFMNLWGIGDIRKLRAILTHKAREQSSRFFYRASVQ